ncbi:MFS general substrate transporter [Daldinia grandis]|nr:MFS general substrate transporter [Daldinia grandis]
MSTSETETRGKDSIGSIELTQENISENLPEAPDGGLRAWLVTAGAACVFFSAMGFSNAFGVFEEYYLAHQLNGQSPDKVAWIGSLAVALQFLSGNIRSLCKEYWQFMLAQGVLMGTVVGFLQFPAMAALSQFFNKKRAAALGIAISGSSLGGVIFPIALSKMLNGTSLGFGCHNISQAFKETRFILLTIALFFMLLGTFVPLFYIPTYAVSRGMDPTLASYLLAIINAASTFGRVIPGILADKFGRLNMFAFGGIITSIVIFCWNKTESTAELVVYSIAIGFSTGTVISGASAAFTEVPKDPRDIGTYLGMGMSLSSIAALIGPPVNGIFVSKYGGYSEVSIFSGVMVLVGGFIGLATKATTSQGLLGRMRLTYLTPCRG